MPAPDVSEVLTYLEGTQGSNMPDAGIVTEALAAEKAAQAAVCRAPGDDDEWPADLSESLKRRVARNIAMRGLPLGAQASLDTGTFRPGNDPEVRRLEAPYRKLVVG